MYIEVWWFILQPIFFYCLTTCQHSGSVYTIIVTLYVFYQMMMRLRLVSACFCHIWLRTYLIITFLIFTPDSRQICITAYILYNLKHVFMSNMLFTFLRLNFSIYIIARKPILCVSTGIIFGEINLLWTIA